MSKEEYLALAAAQYEALQAVGRQPDLYTLEEQFDQLWTALGRQVLEQTLGAVPANAQKKTGCSPATDA